MKRTFTALLLASMLFNDVMYAQEDSKDEPISKAEMEKAMLNIELPSPGALVLRLQRALGDIDWKQYINLNNHGKYDSLQDKAFHLGARGADVYFLTASKDTTNLITVSEMIYKSMNKLHINSKDTKKISSVLKKKIKQKDKSKAIWQEIFSDVSELKDGINENLDKKYKDGDKTILYNIGGWLEGYRLATNALKDNYSKNDTSILVQKDLVTFLLKKLEENSKVEKFKGYDDIKNILKGINQIISNAKDNQLNKQDVDSLVSKLEKIKQYI